MDDQAPRHPAIPSGDLHPDIIYSLVIDGDLSQLNEGQRVAYYTHRCKSLGIDPGEQPFALIKLSGKLVLYATKGCANALTRIGQLSIAVQPPIFEGDLIIVSARASDPSGRFVDDMGVVDTSEKDNKGRTALTVLGKANCIMKAVTKAKRRAVLALNGLGILDVSEVEDIPASRRGPIPEPQPLVQQRQAPKCSGKAAGLAGSIERRVREYSEALGKDEQAVYHAVLRRCEIPAINGTAPTAHQLTVEQGAKVREALLRAQAKLDVERAAEAAEPEIIDAESTEREPGEDRDIDDEQPDGPPLDAQSRPGAP